VGALNWLRNHRLSDPVDGTYRLTACSAGSSGAAYSNCRMDGVVTAPGIAPVAVEHYCTAPTKKWPSPGQDLPVLVDRADPRRLQIKWDEIPSGRERGRQAAQAAADMMAQRMTAWQTAAGQTAAGQAGAGQPGGGPFGAGPFGGDFHIAGMSALGEQAEMMADSIQQAVQQAMEAAGMPTVLGAPGRPMPGAPGGGTTPEQAAQAFAGQSGMREATAVVLAAHEVSVPFGMPGAGPGGVVDITLDVSAPDGSAYSTMTRISFSTVERKARIAVPGSTLPVLIDPSDRSRIVIDTRRLSGW
jgi:hypothetical protein